MNVWGSLTKACLFVNLLILLTCLFGFLYLQGSFLCGPCHPGFIGDGYTGCHPGDLCTNGSHTCHENAQCTQTGAGRFKCRVWQRYWFTLTCPFLITSIKRRSLYVVTCFFYLGQFRKWLCENLVVIEDTFSESIFVPFFTSMQEINVISLSDRDYLHYLIEQSWLAEEPRNISTPIYMYVNVKVTDTIKQRDSSYCTFRVSEWEKKNWEGSLIGFEPVTFRVPVEPSNPVSCRKLLAS